MPLYKLVVPLESKEIRKDFLNYSQLSISNFQFPIPNSPLLYYGMVNGNIGHIL